MAITQAPIAGLASDDGVGGREVSSATATHDEP